MKDMRIRTDDLITNPTPRVPVAVCVDTSESMDGTPITELNAGLALFYEGINGHEVAKYAAEVAIVAFSDSARIVRLFGSVRDAAPPQIPVDHGSTSLGSGVRLSLDLIEGRKREYQANGVEYYQPWLVVITDGQPTDDSHEDEIPRIASLASARKLTTFALGVGPGADLNVLGQLSPGRPPLRLKGLQFQKFFEFLSKSVAAVSCSQPGQKVVIDTTGMGTWAEL